MLIVDCFTFYNEFDLLTYRLNTLNSVVDYFILVEARQTHVGKEKELLYENNKERYAEFKDKIIHIVVDLPHIPVDVSKNEQWVNERFQRNSIKDGIDKLNLSNDDLIIISDLDEIADPVTLEKIKTGTIPVDISSLEMQFHYYNLNTISTNSWASAKILSFKKFNELSISCSDIRARKCDIIKNGGWHLSYFGDSNFIKNKIENFAHQEFNNNDYTDMNKINQRLSSGQDIYGRWYVPFNKVPISQNAYLPPEFRKYLSKFIVLE
jgi:beta-1,4-mannosyl-glycoprotein beta-1,4-N-acetylglucosaminyltransferase